MTRSPRTDGIGGLRPFPTAQIDRLSTQIQESGEATDLSYLLVAAAEQIGLTRDEYTLDRVGREIHRLVVK